MIDRVEQRRHGQTPRKTSTQHPFIGIEHRVIDSPAFSDLRHSSVRVLLAVARQLTKDNNGHLQATWSWCQRYGIGSDNTLTDAIADLIAHGFLYRSKSHGANGVWAKYAVTWLPIKKQDGLFTNGFKMFAWRDWEPSEKKTYRQKLRQEHRKNCDFRGGLPAETAASHTAKTEDYEYMLPCYSNEAAHLGKQKTIPTALPGISQEVNGQTDNGIAPWIVDYLATLAARGLADACPVETNLQKENA